MKLNQLRATRLQHKSGSEDDGLTLTKLYTESPTWLHKAHANLDEAVLAAYGFKAGISDDELLASLLGLSFERANEEATRAGDAAGLTRLAANMARRPARVANSALPLQSRSRRVHK